MPEQTHFDLVIGGAGISSLLLGYELSKTKKVLIIEANDDLPQNKYWVTLKDCVDTNPFLKPFVDTSFNTMDFSDAYQNVFTLNGDYILWDTNGLTMFLKEQITKNNGIIRYNQRFCSYKITGNQINIFANENCYATKLFIDCMGYNSPLILAKDLIKFKGHYLLYGAKLKLRESIKPICLSNVMLHKHPKYFEVFPTSNGEVFATMIYPTKSIVDMKGLEADFNYITTNSIYSKYFEKDSKVSNLWGVVPVGTIKRKALDKIFFFGESAQSNPAATGTCLTRLLLNYKRVAGFINLKIAEDDLSEKSLSAYPEVLNPFIRDLQLYAFKDILSWNSDRFAKFISIVDHVDHDLINKFLFGSLLPKDILTLKHMTSLINPKKIFLSKPLLQTLLKFT